ncbi:MAG: hypothetical protein KDD69_09475 [Bdellovibrionales bacterium]|nr:hypothetical protein [Bdellovibrionales bacterium]
MKRLLAGVTLSFIMVPSFGAWFGDSWIGSAKLDAAPYVDEAAPAPASVATVSAPIVSASIEVSADNSEEPGSEPGPGQVQTQVEAESALVVAQLDPTTAAPDASKSPVSRVASISSIEDSSIEDSGSSIEDRASSIEQVAEPELDARLEAAVFEEPSVGEVPEVPRTVLKRRAGTESLSKLQPKGAPFSGAGLPRLEPANLGAYQSFSLSADGTVYQKKVGDETVRFTLDPALQQHAEELLKSHRIPWGAIVALEPHSGRVLALASYSDHEKEQVPIALQSGFPAASLFKVVTAAAAVERSGLNRESEIHFRGGNYTLTKYNYYPDRKSDRRSMSLASALGKSCNPVFARVALNHLDSDVLQQYAENFGFNAPLPFELPLGLSEFTRPEDDYELALTAAGFRNAQITPLHAAALAAAVGNRGVLMRPFIVDSILDGEGNERYRTKQLALRQAVLPSTAREVLRMMDYTVVEGTARRHFRRAATGRLRSMAIAGKTGTLRGPNPKGVYHWFIGIAPSDEAEVVIASLVIDPGNARINGTGLGRKFLEFYFKQAESRLHAAAQSTGESAKGESAMGRG